MSEMVTRQQREWAAIEARLEEAHRLFMEKQAAEKREEEQ